MATDIRALLEQCRQALQAADPGFAGSALALALDSALREQLRAALPPVAAGARTSAQQVAQAWQTVARGLKLSHPALYDELQARVMNLLNAGEVADPATELLALEAEVRKLRAEGEPLHAKLHDMVKRAADSQRALDALYKALAIAAPGVAGSTDAQTLALQRLEALVNERQQPAAVAPSRSGQAPAPARLQEADGPVPGMALLRAVVEGSREFSKEQREWMVSECMTLTRWEFTPVELLEKGDAWMAQRVLDAQPPA